MEEQQEWLSVYRSSEGAAGTTQREASPKDAQGGGLGASAKDATTEEVFAWLTLL